ncbi:MAG: DNA polymerase III subunit chi [Burkholderiaceae bacterium]
MTEVSFHFNVSDSLGYACRLLRKATRLGAKVAVLAPELALAELDRALWTLNPLEFCPHVRLSRGTRPASRLRPTPIWLLDAVADAPDRDVLLNLGQDVPAGFESFARIIEIVATGDRDREAGRERWKHYASRGYAISRHEVSHDARA